MMSSEGSSSSSRGESIVEDAGRSRSTCGYCKSRGCSSISHGLWADSLTVDDYQDLLDRGWRRCGSYVYTPEMETTCCPAYTIRLRAKEFIPSKEQLRVSRRMQRYLDGIWDGKTKELVDKSDNQQSSFHVAESLSLYQVSVETKTKHTTKEEKIMDYLSEQLELATQSFVKRRDIHYDIQFPKGSVKKVSQAKKKQFIEGAEHLSYTSNISFQIAAILRRIKSDVNGVCLAGLKQNSSLDANASSFNLSPKNIAEELVTALQHFVRIPGLVIRACNGYINFYSDAENDCPDMDNHSVALSNVSSIKCESKEKSQRKSRQLDIHLKRSCFDPEEFALYKKYQIKVHNDEPESITESSYTEFLIDTPLIYVPPTGDGKVPPCGFGSFHQQYRIDDKLIAVGVIDILPKCVSSKYLFWDPDFAFLSLGKFSALREIEWVKENQHHCSSLEYYYLGYYIHSCSKMRYKGAYGPSELLFPHRYEWLRFDIAKPLLDRKKYVVLSDHANSQNTKTSSCEEPANVSVVLSTNDGGILNDVCLDSDVEMSDSDSDSEISEDEPYYESDNLTSISTDLGNILLGLDGDRVRYKVLQADVSPFFRSRFEKQLLRYLKVVGPHLSERMVYSANYIKFSGYSEPSIPTPPATGNKEEEKWGC